MIRTKSEDAVSPVIGVMLMLVVTIIIAAVVAVFASGVSMDAEPAPATVVDVVGISMSEETTITYEYKLDSDAIRTDGDGTVHNDPSWVGRLNNFNGDADGNQVEGGEYVYYYVTTTSGQVVFARKYSDENDNTIWEPWGNTELGNKYLSHIPYEETIYKPTLILNSLHGDVLDLSKISVKVSYTSNGGKPSYDYEMPQNSLTGIISPGDTLRLPMSGAPELMTTSDVVDVIVFYGTHKIAEAEELVVN